MSKFVDFDRMWKEAMPEEADRPKVRVFGEDVSLPAAIPARIILRAMRAAEAGEDADATLTFDEIYQHACALYGKDRIEGWLNQGLTLGQLGDLVNHAIRIYSGGGDDEGNETAPQEGAKRPRKGASSNDGA